jgi:hypothetical protein
MAREKNPRITTSQVADIGKDTEKRDSPREKGVYRWSMNKGRKKEVLQ